jgi:bifunctional DNase/RNase
MNPQLTPMSVVGLQPRPEAGDAILVLATPDRRCLGLVVPMNEGNRLARVLRLAGCPCTPVYDLLRDVAARAGLAIHRAVVDAACGGFGAGLVFTDRGGEVCFDCHPADAVALAVRAGAPILATVRALAHACPAPVSGGACEAHQVARWLEEVKPADFAPPGEPA